MGGGHSQNVALDATTLHPRPPKSHYFGNALTLVLCPRHKSEHDWYLGSKFKFCFVKVT
jgi:hypothetical protein